MEVIVCLDDSNGMMFNRRRQSRDRLLIEDIIQSNPGKTLRMCEYSAKLFEEFADKTVSETFLEEAGPEDLCFVENRPLLPFADQIRRLVIYRWNRRYPVDQHFDLPLDEQSWHLVSTTEFPGSSHEKITKEEYLK